LCIQSDGGAAMIQNPTILQKIDEKANGDTVMKEFLQAIIENESDGKQYSKYFKSLIEQSVKNQNTKEDNK